MTNRWVGGRRRTRHRTGPQGFEDDLSMMGFGTIAKKVFGTPNDRKIKATRPLVAAINALEPEFQALDDAGLKAKTAEFRERFQKGESLDDLLPEAFANAREAARRTLGLRPFDVQLMGGVFLHQGNISEMKTGEGKTLVATMPAYLNALTGRGVHIVTVNDYLAKPRRRLDGPRLPRPRPQRRRRHPRHGGGGQEGRLRRRHHLRHQQRARLRLPARQHEVRPRPGPPARSLFRHRRRGRTRSWSTRRARRSSSPAPARTAPSSTSRSTS